MTAEIKVPISPGELVDKITILEIKSARMTDPAKLANVRTELTLLQETWRTSATWSAPAPSARSSSSWLAPSTSRTMSAPR